MSDPIKPIFGEPIPFDPYSIDFKFMVFQGFPKNNVVYYYLDGEKTRHRMKQEVLLKLVSMYSGDLYRKAYDASNTYSFYLWDRQSQSLEHLTPRSAGNDPYQDSIFNILIGKEVPKIRGQIKEDDSIESSLSRYGFNIPSGASTKNMQFAIIPNAPAKNDKFAMLRSLLSGRRR